MWKQNSVRPGLRKKKPSWNLSEPCFSAALTWYLWELKDKEISTMSVDGGVTSHIIVTACKKIKLNEKKIHV